LPPAGGEVPPLRGKRMGASGGVRAGGDSEETGIPGVRNARGADRRGPPPRVTDPDSVEIQVAFPACIYWWAFAFIWNAESR
jgi:hypothetical protein